MPGAKWEQDGHLFNADGSPALHVTQLVDEIEPEDDPDLDSQVRVETDAEIPKAQRSDESLDTMHWKRLKVFAESFGIEWTNKQDVIAKLRGK